VLSKRSDNLSKKKHDKQGQRSKKIKALQSKLSPSLTNCARGVEINSILTILRRTVRLNCGRYTCESVCDGGPHVDPRSVGFWPGNEAGTRRFGSIKYNRIKPLNRAFDDCAPEDDDDALSFVRIGCWRIVFSESSGTQSWRIFEAFFHLRLQNIDGVTNVGNAV
jgi:hypothetical protein